MSALPGRTRELWAEARELAVDMSRMMTGTHLLTQAASLAYTTILSIIPALAVSFATFKAFGGMEKVYATIEPLIMQNLAEGSDDAIGAIRGFIANVHTGAIGMSGFLGLVVTSMAMLYSIEKAVNQIWRVSMRRNWVQRIAYYWLFITMGPVALAVAVGAATSAAVPFKDIIPTGAGFFVSTTIIFTLVFKIVPHRPVHWKPALAAASLTAAGWSIARVTYSIYTREILAYNKIYGSLGAVPILLLWIYIIWVIVLSGAAMSAALQKRFEARS